MSSEKYIPNFAQAEISLEEFLTISDERLQDIGVKLPFHRRLILEGIAKFILHDWSNKSLYVPMKVGQELSFFDLTMIVVNLHRQLVVVKAHMHWVKRLGEKADMLRAYDHFKHSLLANFANRLKSLEKMVKKKYGGQVATRPLLISKNKKSPQWNAVKLASLIAVPLIAFGAFRIIFLNK